MKFIGNYNYIDPKWIEYVLSNPGYGRPKEGKRPDSPEEEQEYTIARNAGYNDNAIYFWMFDNSNFPFDLDLPFIDKPYHWWITKMLPGNFMPMHIDPHTVYQKNSKRLWLPWQDWEAGHVFAYEDIVLTKYRKGDVWEYESATGLHGAANIGHVPRIILQVSTYDV